MPPHDYASLHDGIERIHIAVAEVRSDVRAFARTQDEHARRLADLEDARHAASARVSAAEADTGKFNLTAAMRIEACQRLEAERYARLEAAIAQLAEAQRYWSRWILGTAASLAAGVVVAGVAAILRLVG